MMSIPVIVLASGASSVMEYGLTVTVVAVSVVFSALILLYLAYTLVGYVCSGKFAERFGRKTQNASSQMASGADEAEIAAAIAAAMELARKEDSAHDDESYVITIRRK